MTSSFNRDWIKENERRVMEMDRLYILDGRHRKTLADGSPNPLHGLYTGLKEKANELEKQLEDDDEGINEPTETANCPISQPNAEGSGSAYRTLANY